MISIGNVVVGDSIDECFEQWYEILSSDCEVTNSRDGEVAGEVLGATTILRKPTNNVMKSSIRNLSMKYAVGEMLWYMSANNNLSEIQKYTKNWDRMSDDGKTVNSNYGYCIRKKFGFNQWQTVIDELKVNPSSRRAVIHIKDASKKSFFSKDMNCTVYLQFLIRDNKLNMYVSMRSNDIWLGFPYDVFQFTCMQILMSMELGIEVGEYVHSVGSLHLYQRNLPSNS